MNGNEEAPPRPTSSSAQAVGEPPPAEGEAEAFGTWLRRQREGREIDLREIAETSKISIRYLQALEVGRFDLLPAEVFAKGFLRQYARYVGLDPEEVINAFLAAHRDPAEELERTASKTARRRSVGLGRLLLAIVAILLLVGFVVWLRSVESSAGASPAPDADLGAVDSTEPAAPGGALDSPALGETSPDSSPVAPAENPSDGQSAEDEVQATGVDEVVAASDEAPGASPMPPLGIRIVVDFLGRCWIEASVDGERRVAETRVQGESLELEGRNEIVLRVGDAGAVEVEVDGEPWAIENGAGQVRTWSFRAGETIGDETRGQT